MVKETHKSTMLVITTGFLVVHALSSLKWTLYVALVSGIIGIVSSSLSKKIEWGWFKLSKVLSFIIPNVLLTVVFYLILFPISLLSKIFNKDPLMISGKYDSYFVEVKRRVDKKSLETPW